MMNAIYQPPDSGADTMPDRVEYLFCVNPQQPIVIEGAEGKKS